ncbi:MAG: hypothetical protein ACP5QW_09855, partial [bacterium]
VYGVVLGILTILIVITMTGCGSSGSKSGGGPFTSEQISALAQIFASSATSAATMSTTSYSQFKITNLNSLSSCGPNTLIPPTSCPGGGNIYYTINMNCTMPSGCCSANPPCSQDSMSITGQGSTNYNSCAETITTTGDHIMINGTINMGLTSKATMQCGGAVDVDVTVTFTGMPTISVNGHDVCHGDIFITAKGHAGASNYVSVSGTICGQSVYEYYNQGCAVTCADKSCCYAGTYCSTCYANACIPVGNVDCCNGYNCPSGTTCVQSGGKTMCQYSLVNFGTAIPSFDLTNQ